MSLTTKTNGGVAQLNAAGPNTLADNLRALGFGSLLRQLRTSLRRQSFAAAPANPYNLATVQVIALPDDAKASTIHRAYARAGTGAPGELKQVATQYATPTSGQIAVSPNGDLVIVATDGYTDVDIDYEPAKQDVLEQIITVPSGGVATLGAALTGVAGSGAGPGVLMLMEAEILAGTIATAVGKKIVDQPGTSVATGHAALNIIKNAVQFAGADAGSSARVKLGIVSAINVNAALEAASPLY